MDASRACLTGGASGAPWLNAVTSDGGSGYCARRLEPRPDHDHAELVLGRVDVHDRLLAEGRRRRVREPVDEPGLAEVVVDHQHAVGLEHVAHGAERLFGEHVALEAHAGERGLQRQRVDEREHHEVVLLLRRPQEVPGIVGHRVDARVRVRPVRVHLAAEPEDGRVDFDGVDAARRRA